MATLVFTSHLDGTAPADECRYPGIPVSRYPGETVGEILDAAFADYPQLRSYIVDDQERIRKHVVIFVGDRKLNPGEEHHRRVGVDDTIYVLQALSGG